VSRAEASGATIVVLDRNRVGDTLGCLGGLAGAVRGRARIAVMDNRSRDGSVAALRLGLREPAGADAAPHPVGS